MSSAILLVAIVAIWACALVPKWVRRSQEAAPGSRLGAGDDVNADPEDGYPEEAAYSEADYEAADAYQAEGTYEDAYGADLSDGEYDDEASGPDDLAAHAHVAPGRHAGPGMLVGHMAAAYEQDEPAYDEDEPPYGEYEPAQAADGPAQAAANRERVLRTRRRMLIALILLFAVTLGAAVLSIAHWWLVVPSASMLLVYVMLLRAAVRADAEYAARRAAAQSRAVAAARSARAAAAAAAQERARAAAAASAPQPTAEVISIGERAAQASDPDEPYDQYTDATARAIGD